MMLRLTASFAFGVALIFAAPLSAQEQPIVRVEISPESVIVGERAELTVTVLVPTWFTKPSVYPSFELSNAITREPADSSFNLRERVGRDSWSGIVKTYEIVPLLGANYVLDGQSIRVTYANPGSDPITVDMPLPTVSFRGEVPAGAEGLDPYIAGESLNVSLTVEGETGDLKPGDAIVLQYSAELDGLPAIFLPPLAPEFDLEGVSVYRDSPRIEDDVLARRTEKVTLVFEAGGDFEVPGLALSFWDTSSLAIQTVATDGLAFSVEGPPLVIVEEVTEEQRDWLPVAMLAAAVAAIALLLFRFNALAAHVRETARKRRESEAYAFAQLTKLLQQNKRADAYRALLRWLERLEPARSLADLMAVADDERLTGSIDELRHDLYAESDSTFDSKLLARLLKDARRRYLHRVSKDQQTLLPPLNP